MTSTKRPISSRPLPQFLGIKMTHISPERVTAELYVKEELNNRFDIMHGGAIMALADNVGGTATTANLKEGQTDDDDREQDQFLRCHARSATPPRRNASRCIAAAPPWSGRPASPAMTAGYAPWSRRRNWCWRKRSSYFSIVTDAAALPAAGVTRAPRLTSTTPKAQTTMPAIDSASSFSPNNT